MQYAASGGSDDWARGVAGIKYELFFLILFLALAVDVDMIHISDNSVHQNEHVNKLASGGFT